MLNNLQQENDNLRTYKQKYELLDTQYKSFLYYFLYM